MLACAVTTAAVSNGDAVRGFAGSSVAPGVYFRDIFPRYGWAVGDLSADWMLSTGLCRIFARLVRGSLWDCRQSVVKAAGARRRYLLIVGDCAHTQPGFSHLTKSKTDLDRIVQELMDGDLSKAQRIKRLRELAKSGDDVPEELMDQALRKLMERITD